DPAFGGVMPALPGAREEAQAVAQVLGVPALVGEGATEAALRKAMGEGVETLHLATHGLFNLADPLRSALFVSEGGRAKAITAERLFANPLKARLVVLSACETGIGEAAAGDDFLGLPRSFYLGGARTVLASLWPVDDRATTAFMRVFHERARGGDYGAAWLAARETLIQAGEPPWIHGAFVLGGAAKR
ncbi:MAG: CHAT domain-containing protein, partial [Alphaproteobacteria bacterium]|nr:CHAT domain-containing protein [Alphaproteobacteria bacterium]